MASGINPNWRWQTVAPGHHECIGHGPRYYTHGITVCKHSAARHVERFAANIVYGHTHRRDSYTINTVAIPHIAGHSPGCLCQRQPMYMHTDPDSRH